MHVGQPIQRGRWTDPWVVGNAAALQGLHVRQILLDPCSYLIALADGAVTGDDHIYVVGHTLEQPDSSADDYSG